MMGVLRGIAYSAAVEVIDLAARPVFWLIHRPAGGRRKDATTYGGGEQR